MQGIILNAILYGTPNEWSPDGQNLIYPYVWLDKVTGIAYDMAATVFTDGKRYWFSLDSCVTVEFPYQPTMEIFNVNSQ